MRTSGKITVSAIALLALAGGTLLIFARAVQLQAKAYEQAIEMMQSADPKTLSAMADASERFDVYETTFAGHAVWPAGA